MRRALLAGGTGAAATAALVWILGALSPPPAPAPPPPSDVRRTAIAARTDATPPRDDAPMRATAPEAFEAPRMRDAARAARPSPRPAPTAPPTAAATPAAPAPPRFVDAPRFATSALGVPTRAKSDPAGASAPPTPREPEKPVVAAPTPSPQPTPTSPAPTPPSNRGGTGGATRGAVARHSPRPSYPSGAREAGEEGDVVLRLNVDVEGRVTDVEVVSSTASVRLREAAISTARRWTFEPATDSGRRAATTVVRRFAFRLEDPR
jgi:protein TonB